MNVTSVKAYTNFTISDYKKKPITKPCDMQSSNENLSMNSAPLGTFNQFALGFSGRAKLYKVDFHKLSLENVPCPCCGKKMITTKEFQKVFDESKIPKTVKGVIDLIEPYKENLHEIPLAVFNKIKGAITPQNENQSLQKIMSGMRYDCLVRLQQSQIEVFKKINQAADKLLTKKRANKVNNYLKECKDIVYTQSGFKPFKRKTFLNSFDTILKTVANSDATTANTLRQIAEQLPNSENSLDAFFVKYSTRGAGEIVHSIVKPSTQTIEHIRPHSTFKNLEDADSMSNLIIECESCNTDKSDSSLIAQLKQNPQMKENIQKYFNYFTELFKNGKLFTKKSEYDSVKFVPVEYKPSYLKDVSNTLARESRGLIKVDTTELDKLI